MSWTQEDVWAFISAVRIGRLATATAEGEPHVVPLWYEVQGERIVAYSRRTERKARNIAMNPRFSLVVDDDSVPYRGVTLRGRAEVVSREELDPGPLIERLAIRFMGLQAGSEVGSRLGGDPEAVTLLLHPRAWSSWDYSSRH